MKLERGLKHQLDAVYSVINVFREVDIKKSKVLNSNPIIDLDSPKLKYNISKIQDNNKIYSEFKKYDGEYQKYLNLDIKMETGTGKTFTQVQTIFELNDKYGFNKFIIIVPTKPIKAGTKNFIESTDTKSFFRDEYDSEIELRVIEPLKKRKGKEYFPGVVREFVMASNNTKRIQVMLINSQLITNGKMLLKEYDTNLLDDYTIPSDAIKTTKPIIIIDEPHKFDKNNITYKKIEAIFDPQLIIRYGATFPYRDQKNNIRDYKHLLYNLTSIQAFNDNLVKGIISEYVPTHNEVNIRIKIINIINKEKCIIHRIDEKLVKSFELYKDDTLSIIHDDFDSISILEIRKNSILLSNGKECYTNEELIPDCYSLSYQELMIETALERHFEVEKDNFNRGIKSLALFFIDDVNAYRPKVDKKAYILESFERLLKQKLEKLISNMEECDYKQFLLESYKNISYCHGGYFSVDNTDSSDEIAQQVNEILNDKETLLKIKNENKYNLRRFIFSKWTLKEGWDNPNIFTITKLRSSGSENSKLQEVGRGLRLPVNNNLNRISNEQFFLNYIVSFSEKNFINQLRNEINSESLLKNKIALDIIREYCKSNNLQFTSIYIKLLTEEAIDPDGNIINEDKLNEICPGLINVVSKNKIYDKSEKENKFISIRKNKYYEINKLWELLNRKYIITYKHFLDDEIESAIFQILSTGLESKDNIITDRKKLSFNDEGFDVEQLAGLSLSTNKVMKYNTFIKKLNELTNVPIKNIHNSIVRYNEKNKVGKNFFNSTVLSRLCVAINNWKSEELFKRFTYKKTDLPIHPTSLTNSDGSLKNNIAINNIGILKIDGTPQEKYLYDSIAYDSEIEKNNILEEIEEVTVFGKIPKNSIRIPVANGGTYSPDFMYLIDKGNDNKEMSLIIESKNVISKQDIRGTENYKIECAKKLFNDLKKEGININFKEQLSTDTISTIVDNIKLTEKNFKS